MCTNEKLSQNTCTSAISFPCETLLILVEKTFHVKTCDITHPKLIHILTEKIRHQIQRLHLSNSNFVFVFSI